MNLRFLQWTDRHPPVPDWQVVRWPARLVGGAPQPSRRGPQAIHAQQRGNMLSPTRPSSSSCSTERKHAASSAACTHIYCIDTRKLLQCYHLPAIVCSIFLYYIIRNNVVTDILSCFLFHVLQQPCMHCSFWVFLYYMFCDASLQVDDLEQWIAEREVVAASHELGQDYDHVMVSLLRGRWWLRHTNWVRTMTSSW